MKAALATLSASWLACAGCGGGGPSHSLPDPKHPDPQLAFEVGPIVDEHGVDLGPMVAERIRDRRLGSPRIVATPSGSAPYVEAQIQVSSTEEWILSCGTLDYELVVNLAIVKAPGSPPSKVTAKDEASVPCGYNFISGNEFIDGVVNAIVGAMQPAGQ